MINTETNSPQAVALRSMRPNMPPLPPRMRHLPIDPVRGFVVPWFVAWIDGKPEFRLADAEKLQLAHYKKLCWVCGIPVGRNASFVAGPMCGINRTSSEPPCHFECAMYAATACPFLTMPKMVRRENDLPTDIEPAGGCGLRRNPGVALIYVTRSYELFDDGAGKKLYRMGEPEQCIWLCEGRQATRAEVQASIDSGLPSLREMCDSEATIDRKRDAHKELDRYIARFEKWLPTI